MTSAQVVETSVANNSSFQNYLHPNDHTIRTTDTPGFKPFTIRKLLPSKTKKFFCLTFWTLIWHLFVNKYLPYPNLLFTVVIFLAVTSWIKNKPLCSYSYHVTEERILFINSHHGSITARFVPIRYSIELLLKVCRHMKFNITKRKKWIADRRQLCCVHPDVRRG